MPNRLYKAATTPPVLQGVPHATPRTPARDHCHSAVEDTVDSKGNTLLVDLGQLYELHTSEYTPYNTRALHRHVYTQFEVTIYRRRMYNTIHVYVIVHVSHNESN